MSDVTVAQFAEVLKVPVERLLVQLDEVTREHAVEDGHFASLEQAPRFALTMSVQLVFQARQVLVLANGNRKREAVTRSILWDPTPEMPMGASHSKDQVSRRDL